MKREKRVSTRSTHENHRPLPDVGPQGRAVVRLKSQEDRRLRRGHPWIFSNEVDSVSAGVEPGALVEFVSARHEWLGVGFFNPHSLIAGRLLDRRGASIDAEFFFRRLDSAMTLRQRLFSDDAYRWVHGESDDLPGLVIDRYGDLCVVESFAAGIDRLMPDIHQAIKRFGPWKSVVLRNDASSRRLEHLPEDVRLLEGQVEGPHTFLTDGIHMIAHPLEGQKTGYFFDQRLNRRWTAPLARGKKMLDVFCHTGGFSHYALHAGSAHCWGVDISESAIATARTIAEKNGWADRCQWQRADAFEFLSSNRETFDIVVLDPPRFASSKKALPEAVRSYIRLFSLGLKKVTGGGFLAAASCSQHVDREEFRKILARAAQESNRKIKVIFQGGAGPDHPVRFSMPESEYLKFALVYVVQ